MTARSMNSPHASTSLAIRQEIQRFESVHPSIYAIYDLIDAVTDPVLQQQIRDHVVCIEDSFVNSQEWTLSRAVPDLKLGVLGTVNSGKSALVHRYLTGSYLQEESPEGGRFKKEVVVDGQSHLLLIRDEGGPPEMQFTHWVDAVILVFSLENEHSFSAIYNYYAKMAHYRNTAEIPVILVGTQDSISESNPRVIDDTRARKLAADLKKCSYYETCATYGLNVERVFQDACHKVMTSRTVVYNSAMLHQQAPSTPKHSAHAPHLGGSGDRKVYDTPPGAKEPDSPHSTLPGSGGSSVVYAAGPQLSPQYHAPVSAFKEPPVPRSKGHKGREDGGDRTPSLSDHSSIQGSSRSNGDKTTPFSTPVPSRKGSSRTSNVQKSNSFSGSPSFGKELSLPSYGPSPTLSPLLLRKASSKTAKFMASDKADRELPTPTSTPTQSRKNRRRSNLFTPSKKEKEEAKRAEELGSGRIIPVKQGYLYKKGSKGLNKEWKKKYVTLLDNGRLIYHPSFHDYMEDVHGKEVNLAHTMVKVPGQQRPRGPRSLAPSQPPSANGHNHDAAHPATGDSSPGPSITSGDDALSNTALILNGFPANTTFPPGPQSKAETPNVKKRHKRAKSSGGKNLQANGEDSDGYEFIVVSIDKREWLFEACSTEERESWISAIEQQILNSLQGNVSSKSQRLPAQEPGATSRAVRAIRGNTACADCGAPNPEWASLNLGAVICIECSGIHRNLGTHISRVRSLDLDEWPPELMAVMTSVGNAMVNSVWEANTRGHTKPSPASSREEKERWIRSKYEQKLFLNSRGAVSGQALTDSVAVGDTAAVLLALASAAPAQVNEAYPGADGRAAVHIAAAMGNVVFLQFLIWYQADPNLRDEDGKGPLYYARSAGSQPCIDLLGACGATETAPLLLPSSSGTLSRRRKAGGSTSGGLKS